MDWRNIADASFKTYEIPRTLRVADCADAFIERRYAFDMDLASTESLLQIDRPTNDNSLLSEPVLSLLGAPLETC